MVWCPERLSQACEAAPAASAAMHTVESVAFAGWQEYEPATVMAGENTGCVSKQHTPSWSG